MVNGEVREARGYEFLHFMLTGRLALSKLGEGLQVPLVIPLVSSATDLPSALQLLAVVANKRSEKDQVDHESVKHRSRGCKSSATSGLNTPEEQNFSVKWVQG